MSGSKRLSTAIATGLGEFIGQLETLPESLTLGLMETWADLGAITTWRGRILGLVALFLLFLLPNWAGQPLLALMIALLWLAYAGLAWNLVSGIAGQLALGHALFVGGGAWLGAVLLVKAGIGPWTGLGLVVAAAALVGLAIGWVGLRGGLAGAGFSLLTLLAAEAGRIAAGASGTVPVPPAAMLPQLHGKPVLAYYLILALLLAALLLSRRLLRSRFGYRWLAVREDPVVAAASGIDVFRTRLSALILSAALTAPAGLFLAFSGTPLDIDRLFSLDLSLEIVLCAVIGGLGTLFGPVLGALVVVPLDHALTWIGAHASHPLPGLAPFCFGLMLVVTVALWPRGLWPWLARELGLVASPDDGEDDRP